MVNDKFFHKSLIFEDINCSRCIHNFDDNYVDCIHYGALMIKLFFEDVNCCPYYHMSLTVLFKKYFYKLLPRKYREYPITREEAIEFHYNRNGGL